MVKLIEITGKALSGEWGTDDEFGTGIPVLRTTNFTNEGVINYNNVVTRTITKKNINEKYLRPGDIIIEKSGGSDKQPVGRVIYYDGPPKTYLCNNFTGLLRIKNPDKWFSRYVFYSLFSNYKRGGTKMFQNKTTGLHNLKTDDYVSRFEVIDIEYCRQIEICDHLDRISRIIRLRQEELQKLDELIKARFVETFGAPREDVKGWGLTTLEKCCQLNPRRPKGINDDLMVSFVPMTAVSEDGQIDCSDIKPYKEVKKGFTYFAENDVLFAKITPCMENGKGAVAEGLSGGIGAGSTEFHVLRPIPGISNPYWLYTITMFDEFRKSARIFMTGTGGQLRVPVSYLKDYPISLPPIELQNEFERFVRKIYKSKLLAA